ncbi:MAG: hypothetical protein Q8P61_03790 [Candidatus Nanopelagicales bacterium]|nr:hypothetical protein [Candidatus Nanopelagicales bacterium]
MRRLTGERRRCGGAAGESLVELMVSVAILGTTIVVIIEVLFMMVGGTVLQADEVRGQNTLASWADAVAAAPYTECATPTATPAPFPEPSPSPSAFTTRVISVEYWQDTAFAAACPSPDQGLQLVTLGVLPPAGPIGEASASPTPEPSPGQTLSGEQVVKLVKRQPCSPGSSC